MEGYLCDADCQNVESEAFGTVTLDLDALPLQQSRALLVALVEQGIDTGVTDAEYVNLVHPKSITTSDNPSYPTVDLHLCAGHMLTILDQIGVVDVPEDPEARLEEIEDDEEQV